MKLQHIYFCGSVDAVAYFKKQSELTQTARKLRAVFYWFTKSTPGSAGGQKEAYGEGKSRQEKVSELE